MVNLQAFVTTVQNLTGEVTAKELAQFCRRWVDEHADKVTLAESDRLLGNLDFQSHTLGVICVMHAKIAKLRNDVELLEFLNQIYTNLPHFSAQQIQWAPDIYNRLFEHIGEILLKKGVPLWGIALLERAIMVCKGGCADRLTNIHAALLCLCLKARHFDKALPFLRVDVAELFRQANDVGAGGADHLAYNAPPTDGEKSNGVVSSSENLSQHQATSSSSSGIASFLHKAMSTVSGGFGTRYDEPKSTQPLLKRRSVLLYFYYGAMIYAALEQYEEAALFLEHAICLPMTKKNSAIVLEALKKFNIIALIIGRRKPLESLPSYRSSAIQRTLASLASVYARLAVIIHRNSDNKKDVVLALKSYQEEKRAVFEKDQNVGLMKLLIDACRDKSVKRLGNIFVSLHINDVRRLAHLPAPASGNIDANHGVEQIILRLCRNDQLIARIDDRTQTVVFEEENNRQDGQIHIADKFHQDVDAAMADIVQIGRVLRSYDDSVRLNMNYIEKSTQRAKERMGTGGNGGGSVSLLPEDEGFGVFTGSP